MAHHLLRAFSRARLPILTVALTYLFSVVLGLVMVHAGNDFALGYRDRIVANARVSASVAALEQDQRWQAAVIDFAGNVFAAMVDSVLGLGVVMAYPSVAYRGWIGGIVSVDSAHVSRLADFKEGAYYLTTLALQLIPSSLTGGAGVNLGLANLRPKPFYQGDKWLGLPQEALRDLLRIYLVALPLFLLASAWEFFLR
jgi:hypothetical protein